MNKGIYLFLVLLLFSAGAVIAQEGQSEIPEGMEVLQDGTLNPIPLLNSERLPTDVL